MLAAFPKDLQFVYKHMPLVQIHKNAMNASKAAVAGGKQGKYWEMHDELFKISGNLALEEIRKVAEKLGLDLKRFDADMNAPETDKAIQEDIAVARATDVTGTPSFFINGKRVMNRSFEGMKAMVDEEMKSRKAVKP
jgi:protein-disulfide isomerase